MHTAMQVHSVPMDHWPSVVSILMDRVSRDEQGLVGFYDKRARHTYLTQPVDGDNIVFAVAIFRSVRSLVNERELVRNFNALASYIRFDDVFAPFPECNNGVPVL